MNNQMFAGIIDETYLKGYRDAIQQHAPNFDTLSSCRNDEHFQVPIHTVETKNHGTTTNKEYVQKQKEAERQYLRKWMLRDNM